LTRLLVPGAAALTLLLATSSAAASASAPLRHEIHARSLVPGELIRIDVRAPEGESLGDASGHLGTTPLSFVAAAPGGPFVAWAVLDLDAKPGALPLSIEGTLASGARSSLSSSVDVGAKSFPEQPLAVADKYVNPPKGVQARIEREQALLAKVYARRTPRLAASVFERPVPGDPTGVFGARRVFNGEKRKPHPGIDLHAPEGTPVACSGPGIVALARDLYFSGNTIIVDHGGGLFTIYAHLSRIDVTEGQEIGGGDPLGLSGATGRVTGPHLHWGAKVGSAIFDPTSLLDARLFDGLGAR
jgi:murein DD-endopeptidase MepM/ murein hydrolase activator NlpD